MTRMSRIPAIGKVLKEFLGHAVQFSEQLM